MSTNPFIVTGVQLPEADYEPEDIPPFEEIKEITFGPHEFEQEWGTEELRESRCANLGSQPFDEADFWGDIPLWVYGGAE